MPCSRQGGPAQGVGNRALEDQYYPFDDTIYKDLHGDEHEGVVRRAKSREEMTPRPPKIEVEQEEHTSWAQGTRRSKKESP